jgi:hypothetical protein
MPYFCIAQYQIKTMKLPKNVVFGMVVVDGAIVAPPLAKDPEDNTTPLGATTVFATPPPTKDREDDVTPLVP